MKYLFLIWSVVLFALPSPSHTQGFANGRSIYTLLQYHSSFEESIHSDYRAGYPPSMVDLYLMIDSKSNWKEADRIKKDWEKYVLKLKKKQKTTESDKFLKYAFYKTHRKYLKFYERHTSLKQIFDKGYYDCLSGTSLYILLLDALGYRYQIRETDYHIYLIVQSNNNQSFLLESTDPVTGFVSEPNEIERRQQYYLSTTPNEGGPISEISSNRQEFHFSKSVNNKINKAQLVGLHYYNKGIKLYNQREFLEAIQYLQKGLVFYNSPRIKEFLALVVDVAMQSKSLSQGEKSILRNNYLRWLQYRPYAPLTISYNRSP